MTPSVGSIKKAFPKASETLTLIITVCVRKDDKDRSGMLCCWAQALDLVLDAQLLTLEFCNFAVSC